MTVAVAAPTWIEDLEREAQQTHPSYEGRRRIWGSACAAGSCDKHSVQIYTFPDGSEARGERVEVCDQHFFALDTYYTDKEIFEWFDYDSGQVHSRFNRTDYLVKRFLAE